MADLPAECEKIYFKDEDTLEILDVKYKIMIELGLSESEVNFSLGNFDVNLAFMDKDNRQITQSRVAALKYKSDVAKNVDDYVRAVPEALNLFASREDYIKLQFIQSFVSNVKFSN